MKKDNQNILPKFKDSLIPMAFINSKKIAKEGTVLAADVGGTKTNFALYEVKDERLNALRENTYATSDHESFVEALERFQDKKGSHINAICLGVAGPVLHNRVKGTNFPWVIDGDKLAEELDVEHVTLINDMEANASGLAALTENEFKVLDKGKDHPGNAAVISPGTGLGEAGLYWDGENYHPFPAEGGHCDFSPRTELDVELWRHLHAKFGHVSWERLVSGMGINNIYQFLREFRSQEEPEWLTKKMKDEAAPIVITEIGKRGKDAICKEALDLFLDYLAIAACQVALKSKALGGIYIGGGILPNLIDYIDPKKFSNTFVDAGRMKDMLQNIPLRIVLNEKTALLGAAYRGAMTLCDE